MKSSKTWETTNGTNAYVLKTIFLVTGAKNMKRLVMEERTNFSAIDVNSYFTLKMSITRSESHNIQTNVNFVNLQCPFKKLNLIPVWSQVSRIPTRYEKDGK